MVLGRKVLFALVGGLLGAAQASAQTGGTVSGRVTDASTQQPLSGVLVTIGTRSVATSPEGRYSIAGVPGGTQTLRASRISYSPVTRQVTVTPGQTTSVDVAMTGTAVQVEGIVAVGYGQQRVRDNTGAVQAVTTDDFNAGRVVSAEQLIQGKVAGVQIVDSGEPGGGIQVRVRGGTSINASNEPLFVVDGVPLAPGGGLTVGRTETNSLNPLEAGRNPLSFLNPQDIASITVLKDASATAIYGSRGANGVVIVETKRGQRGAQFSYTTSASTSQVTGEPDLLSAAQFADAVRQFAPSNTGRIGTSSTDWRSLVQRDGFGQEHDLSIAGAGNAMTYRLSLGYLDQAGVLRGSATERVTGSANFSQRLFSDRLNVTASVKGSRTEDEFTPERVLNAATSFAPTLPARDAAGNYTEYTDPLAPKNPLAELALITDRATAFRTIGNVEARYQLPFVTGLTATLRGGYDLTRAERASFEPTILRQQQAVASNPGQLTRNNPTQTNTVIDAFANYQRALPFLDSDIDLTAGFSREESEGDYASFIARGLSSDLLGINGVPSAEEVIPLLRYEQSKLASGFARLNYNVKDRYLLTLSVRRDGSSRFGPDNRWGTFPSAAFAWRVADEEFMDGIEFLSDLKLRASYGVNGNQAFGNYRYLSDYVIGASQVQVQFGNEFVNTIRPSAVDPDIKWEETTSYNVGADYGFLDNRITGTVDVYRKDTDDLLFNVPVAAGTNLSNFVTTNIGSLRNSGVEFGLNANVINRGARGLRYDASFNAAYNRNRILSINTNAGGSDQILTGGIRGGVGNNIQVLQAGEAANAFFVYRHKRGADGKPVYADANDDGNINEADLYEDVNGDGEVNQSDRVAFESPLPDWILGHTSTLGFRNVDLSFTLRANLGNHVYNNLASERGFYDNLTGIAPTNLHASVLEYGFAKPQYFSDVYVEDGSFLRMDNISLGYTIARPRVVQSMRVFGTVQNVFTLTGYSGVDPMAGINGIDNNIYPRARTFSLGATVGF
jgi:iron complex outermembrane receptor protein